MHEVRSKAKLDLNKTSISDIVNDPQFDIDQKENYDLVSQIIDLQKSNRNSYTSTLPIYSFTRQNNNDGSKSA